MKAKLIIATLVILVVIVFSCKKDPLSPSGTNKIELGKTVEDTTMYVSPLPTRYII